MFGINVGELWLTRRPSLIYRMYVASRALPPVGYGFSGRDPEVVFPSRGERSLRENRAAVLLLHHVEYYFSSWRFIPSDRFPTRRAP